MRLSSPRPMLSFKNPYTFPLTLWALSRLWVLLGLLGIAPLLPAPPGGKQALFDWSAFVAWDSFHYHSIVTTGYNYVADGQGYNVAFFPMFPLLIRGLMTLGLPFEVSAILITNGSFLISLILLYRWLRECQGEEVARWAIIAFERRNHWQAALWGVCATATRLPGLALVPAFLVIAWCERRGIGAYLAALFTGLGAALYSLFCWLQFGHPLTFLKVQEAWGVPDHFYGQAWLIMFGEVLLGPANMGEAGFTDPLYPLAVLVLIGLAIWVGRFPFRGQIYAGGALFVIAWLVGGDPFLNVCMIVGSMVLLWRYWRKIPVIALFYGIFSFIGLLSSGRTASLERYTYGIVTVAIAAGIWLHHHPKMARFVVSFSGLMLLLYSIRFAQSLWVA